MSINDRTDYFYTPIAFFQGKILKCGGICTEANKEWFLKDNPGVVILRGYRGDRIDSETHEDIDVEK